MISAERVAFAYLNQEKMKREAYDAGFPRSGPDQRYATSPYERLAHAADTLERLMRVWEHYHPTPPGRYWTCFTASGLPSLTNLKLRILA